MATEKIAVTLDRELVREFDQGVKSGLFKNRSRAIEEAVREKLERRQIVSKWRQRFCTQRLPGLEEQPRGGRPARFSPQRRRRGQSPRV